MFTGTDSLCYEIKTDDVYKDLFQDKELFDNSDYPKHSEFFFDENKKVVGKMKDEAAGMPIKEFIGLRSKMYSYEIDNNVTTKKKCMKTIRSHSHNIKSYDITKCSLSCFDNKRFLLEDGITTLAYGHLVKIFIL